MANWFEDIGAGIANLFAPKPESKPASSSGSRDREGGGSFERRTVQAPSRPAAQTSVIQNTGQVNGSWNAWGAVPQKTTVATGQGSNKPQQPSQVNGSWNAYGYADQKRREKEADAAAQKASIDALNQEREDRSRELSGGATFTTREMSWDEYNVLSPQQRAAVDANKAIVDAVNADRTAGQTGTGDEQYQSLIKQMFGEGGGSDTYAPRTVAVLNALKPQEAVGGLNDLDNYLNLSGLVTDSDLPAINAENIARRNSGQGVPVGEWDARTSNALTFSSAAVSSLSKTLQAGQDLLNAARATQGSYDLLGEPVTQIGFGVSQRDSDLQRVFDVLAQKRDSPLEGVAENLQAMASEYGMNTQDIYNYFDTRLKQADYAGAAGQQSSLGVDSTLQYLNPQEFRDMYLGGN